MDPSAIPIESAPLFPARASNTDTLRTRQGRKFSSRIPARLSRCAPSLVFVLFIIYPARISIRHRAAHTHTHTTGFRTLKCTRDKTVSEIQREGIRTSDWWARSSSLRARTGRETKGRSWRDKNREVGAQPSSLQWLYLWSWDANDSWQKKCHGIILTSDYVERKRTELWEIYIIKLLEFSESYQILIKWINYVRNILKEKK